ncbi:4'-phosphopantetheinyl transferase family protein [Lacinutrix chionoecetis]
MIGNDIVDLKQAAKDSNWQRPGFLNKVFTEKEQEYISTSNNQHQMVWLLWSMKEAAYKVNVQQFGKRFFNPKRIACELRTLEKGIVSIGNETYFTTSKITEDFVYTVATLEASKDFKSECFEVENSNYTFQSNHLKIRFLEMISELKMVSIKRLAIKKKEAGVPMLSLDGRHLNHFFSLTHHGQFCAWVY